jgi:predicted Zn finger-like uncharacterized protein
MPIATTCPNCKALFRLPEEMAGRTVKCQKCASQFVVPKAEAETTMPGVPVAVEEEVIVAEKAQPRGPLSSMPLPPMPIAPPDPSLPVPKQESADDEDKYSDSKTKAPPVRKKRDDEDDRPTRSRRDAKPKAKSATTAIVLGILGFFALAILTCAGGTGVWYVLKNDEPKRVRPPIAKKDFGPKKDVFPKEFGGFKDFPKKDDEQFLQVMQLPNPPAVPIQVVLDKKGLYSNDNQLTQQDAFLLGNKSYKAYSLRMEKGQTYQFDMTSIQFDSYLFILDEANRVVRFDDDSGGNLNAHILFVPNRTATYRVLATTFGPAQGGNYTLAINNFK